ncbi:ribosomal protein S19 family protein [Candidatus Micrarchaeota archaeon]|nr:ribosomal protein S19 family protein [Candidatus Micrarchaeota archaeon]
MAKKFTFKGLEVEEVRKLTLEKFMPLVPSKIRRSMKRMATKMRKFIEKLRKTDPKKIMKTHLREMVIVPEMLDRRIQVYNGKDWVDVVIVPQMLGRRLGEYSNTIKMVKHSGPGIGATRGSKSVELK